MDSFCGSSGNKRLIKNAQYMNEVHGPINCTFIIWIYIDISKAPDRQELLLTNYKPKL